MTSLARRLLRRLPYARAAKRALFGPGRPLSAAPAAQPPLPEGALGPEGRPADAFLRADFSRERATKARISAEYAARAATDTLVPQFDRSTHPRPPRAWVEQQIAREKYWFQAIQVMDGLKTPGWSDPAVDKLPHYGLPEDLTGKRVLDIGCAEGFFSFEAERRGAREVIGIDSFPDSVRRFQIIRDALGSNAQAFLMNVYDLDPKRLGTFDVVLFYGVFYHLRHPQLALEAIRGVATGTLLFQTHIQEHPALAGQPWAKFLPHGMMSGAEKADWDPTVFWLFNSAACLAMLDHVGFADARVLSADPKPFVVRAQVPTPSVGAPPDQALAPWC